MTAATPAPARGGVQTVRRLITYLLLFAMVVIAAIGLSGLLERLLSAGSTIAGDDTSGLAQSLAFSLIAGPLAAALWWLVWRGSGMARDRASVAWPLYLVLASTVSLITFTTGLFSWCAGLVVGTAQPSDLAVGIVWSLVWAWHRWMWRHAAKGPTRLVGVAPAIASLYGLILGAGGAVSALGSLLGTALDFLGAVTFGSPWWQQVLQALVWVVGGGLVWWWHWVHDGVKTQTTGFSRVLLIAVTGFGALGLTLYGIATTLYLVLRLLFDRSEPLQAMIQPLGNTVAAALIGALILVYHRGIVATEADAVRQATRLVTSGVALAVAASGIGVIVNSILAAIGTPLADSGVRPLLLGGISALVVGGPVWWAAWRPRIAGDQTRVATPGRRVYLVVVFGVSAAVALVTLLVIGYQIFAFALENVSGGSLLDRMRQALGLLSATLLVAAYHFALWRGDRARGDAAPARRIDHVILVTGPGRDGLVSAIREATGARVTVWHHTRADVDPSADEVRAALDGIEADRVLVVTGSEGRVEAIPLAN